MISESDSFYTVDLGKYYAMLHHTNDFSLEDYLKNFRNEKVTMGFIFNLGSNS